MDMREKEELYWAFLEEARYGEGILDYQKA